MLGIRAVFPHDLKTGGTYNSSKIIGDKVEIS
jgi:hypothetical protein